MNHFNICPSCIHRDYCVLTTQKEKVWSCSDYDELQPEEIVTEIVPLHERILELV